MVKHSITWKEIQKLTHTKEVELKPCPFCGERAEFRTVGHKHKSFGLRCTGCKIITPVKGGLDGQLRAAEFWNQRVGA